MTKLSDKQEMFCQEYIKNLNATDAYESVYKVARKTADSSAARLLGNDRIKSRIAELQKVRSKRTEITQDMVIMEIANVAFANIGLVCDWTEEGKITLKAKSDMCDKGLASLKSLESIDSFDKEGNLLSTRNKFSMNDKLKALELLSKHLGLLDGTGSDKTNTKSKLGRLSKALQALGNGSGS